LAAEVARRGAVPEQMLRRWGLAVPQELPAGVERHGDHLVDAAALAAWREELTALVARAQRADPLWAGLPRKAASDALGLRAPGPAQRLGRWGLAVPQERPGGGEPDRDHLADAAAPAGWREELAALVARAQRADPLRAGLARKAASDALGLRAPGLLDVVVAAAGLTLVAGRVRDPSAAAGLGAAETGVAHLEQTLSEAPFRAPAAEDLTT